MIQEKWSNQSCKGEFHCSATLPVEGKMLSTTFRVFSLFPYRCDFCLTYCVHATHETMVVPRFPGFSSFPTTTSRQLLKISKEGDSIASWQSVPVLLHVTHTVKKYFLIFIQNFLCTQQAVICVICCHRRLGQMVSAGSEKV